MSGVVKINKIVHLRWISKAASVFQQNAS